MPTNVWVETLDIKKHIVLDHNIDMSTEDGIAEFEGIVSKVSDVLKHSNFYVSDVEFEKLDRMADENKAIVQLRTIIGWLEESGSPGKCTDELQYLYHWADENRVWLGN
ncbi:hypothetical protein [Streptomyces halobius]|uniref:Uncharacterized protein n=1 Tax=Streptomyces halobius TaxID=2879846 RepID=A0ABY4M1K5_9ACTN|nr:hypothetical protein [Streptomyces halobius]UQA91357.1 hypothetical protein K9S39_05220 [Streptomyces halobius]